MTDTAKPNPNPNPLVELLISLIIPSLILMKLSDPEDLGVINALLLALAFPLFWGARYFIARRKLNFLNQRGQGGMALT